MKKIVNTIIVALLLTTIVNIGDLKCQENSTVLNREYYSENMDKINEYVNNNDNIMDDKNIKARMLELIIKYNINQRYQKLYSEELEDMVERQR